MPRPGWTCNPSRGADRETLVEASLAALANIPILELFEGPSGEAREARFWEKVQIGGPQDCWDWTASLTHSGRGYGRFKVASYLTLHANRVAWTLHHRLEPGELIIRHACDRPQCCNPFHLEIGTHADNAADKLARGRHRNGNLAGEENPRAKLREADLPLIIDGFRRGRNNKEIARGLAVDHSMVSRIRVGISWVKQARALGWEPKAQFARKVGSGNG